MSDNESYDSYLETSSETSLDPSKIFQNEKTVPETCKLPESVSQISSSQFLTPKMFIILVSFFNGIYQIRNIGEFMYQKQVLNLSPNIIQILLGVTSAPYTLKPIFGFFYDRLMFKYGKTKYIIIGCSILRLTTSLLLAYNRTNWITFTLLIFLTTLAELFERLVAESSLVISTKKENEEKVDKNIKANHLPIFFGFKQGGALVGLFFGGRIIENNSVYLLFFVTGLLPIIPLIICFIFSEKREIKMEEKQTAKQEFKIMKDILNRPRILAMALFIFMIHLTPSYDSITMFYLMDTLKFTTQDLADLSSCSLLMFILALIWYSNSLYKLKPERIFMGTNFILWGINVSFLLIVFGVIKQYGFSEKLFCLLNFGVNSLVAELNFMPILAIWCAFCPKNLEATSITLFTALISLSYNFGTYFGILLAYALDVNEFHLDNFWLLMVIQNLFLIIVLGFISLNGFPDPSESIEEKNINANLNNENEDGHI